MRYFDHNATSPLTTAARAAWIDAAARFSANPSSPHRLGDRADRALETARARLAGCLGCEPHHILWTSGATESNNTAIAHLAAERAGRLLVSAIEHPCILRSAERHFAQRTDFIPATPGGIVDLDALDRALARGGIAGVALMAANNETGILQPWHEALSRCREHDVPFLCDAAQSLGRLPPAGLGACDFLSACAHKFGGPPGIGFLKAPLSLRPLLVGGPQQAGRRAGTENVPGVLSMIAALEDTLSHIASPPPFAASFAEEIQRRIPGVSIIGGGTPRLWNTVSVIMPEARDCRQRWVVKLDKLGFAVSTGSACSSGKEQPSHVLTAMGFSPAEAGRALRFSSGWATTAGDWAALADALAVAAEELLTPQRAAHTPPREPALPSPCDPPHPPALAQTPRAP